VRVLSPMIHIPTMSADTVDRQNDNRHCGTWTRQPVYAALRAAANSSGSVYANYAMLREC